MRRLIYPPSTLVRVPNLHGDGSDGNVVISSNTTLTRDMYYNNLTINSGNTLYTNGFRIFVKNILVNKGTIDCSGSNASGQSAGAGAPSGTLAGGVSGGAGGSQDNDGKSLLQTFDTLSGNGGNGGNGGSSSGGTGSQAVAPTNVLGSVRDYYAMISGRGLQGLRPPGYARVAYSANQLIPQATWTILNFNNILVNQDNCIFPISVGNQINVIKGGLYQIKYDFKWSNVINSSCNGKLQINDTDVTGSYSATFSTTNLIFPSHTSSTVAYLSPNDTISVWAYTDNAGGNNIIGTNNSMVASVLEITRVYSSTFLFNGGPGGGGGGGGSVGAGGGGGGGGGVIMISANILDNSSGVIRANGGNGANAPGTNAGGGGGGSGGLILLIYSTLQAGSLLVSGGSGGSGSGSGRAGTAGGSGAVIQLQAL